jgi:hypothetical protein
VFSDTSANLLFKIDADAGEAKRELSQFRGVLKRDLAGMNSEFKDLDLRLQRLHQISADNIQGNLGGVRNMLAGLVAGVGALAVAAGGALVAMAKKAADYAEEIEGASDKTGIAVEEVSKLRYSAESAGVQFSLLTNSLVLFESAITDARRGVKEKEEAFRALGITQEDLTAGTKDLLGLLYKTSDAFKDQSERSRAGIGRQAALRPRRRGAGRVAEPRFGVDAGIRATGRGTRAGDDGPEHPGGETVPSGVAGDDGPG